MKMIASQNTITARNGLGIEWSNSSDAASTEPHYILCLVGQMMVRQCAPKEYSDDDAVGDNGELDHGHDDLECGCCCLASRSTPALPTSNRSAKTQMRRCDGERYVPFCPVLTGSIG